MSHETRPRQEESRLEAKPVAPQTYAPRFRLRGSDGREYVLAEALRRGRRRLILLFPQRPPCPAARHRLRGLSRLHRSLQNAEAEVWVVWPCSPKETRLLAARWELPFPVLADEGGTVHRRYTGSSERVGLFVIDEYGVVEEAWVVPEETAWPDPESLLPLLRGLEHQCPE